MIGFTLYGTIQTCIVEGECTGIVILQQKEYEAYFVERKRTSGRSQKEFF